MNSSAKIMSPRLAGQIAQALFGCAAPGVWDEFRQWCEVWSVQVPASPLEEPRPGGRPARLPNVAGLRPFRNEAGEGTKARLSVRKRLRRAILQESVRVDARDPLEPMPLPESVKDALAAQAAAASMLAGAAMRGRAR